MVALEDTTTKTAGETDPLLRGHDDAILHQQRSDKSLKQEATGPNDSSGSGIFSSWRPLSWHPLIGSRHTMGLVAVVLVLLGAACSISWVHNSRVDVNGDGHEDLDRNPAEQAAFMQAMHDLDSRIQGHVVWPSNGPAFANASRVWNQCFREQPPAAVIEIANEADVQLVVPLLHDIQRNFSVPFCIRSGGHDYAGWSTVPHGIILSLSSLNGIDFQLDGDNENNNDQTATVTVGPAVRVRDILEQVVIKYGYGSVIGFCQDVAEGGYTLGGGQGSLTRAYGLAVDNLIQARVVLANGQVVTASTAQHSNLFWALRGAGQGNFGVVTQMKFTYHPANRDMLVVRGIIPLNLAYNFFSDFGKLTTPPWAGAIFSNTDATNVGVGNLPVSAILMWNGVDLLQGQAFWNATLYRLLPHHVVHSFTFETISWYNVSTRLVPNNEGMRVRIYNGYLYPKQNSPATWQYILDHLWDVAQQTLYANVLIEYWGGSSAFNAVAPNATAFYWRDAIYNVRLENLVPVDLGPEEFESQQSLFDSQWAFVEPYLTGAYANYPQTSLEHPLQRTYGENLPRLQRIKLQYDPENVFRRPHGISFPNNKR